MEGFAYTKGPWQAIEGTTTGQAVIAPDQPKVRRNVAACGGPNRIGNARLIAAAPELLADAIEAERMFRWYGDLHAAKPDPDKAARNYEMSDRLAATIAKATGAS